ncbi:MAG TPA: carboxypeptidase-like regulatory domain-containing protein [Gemmataceae bacterium]|nr:carboxypeptidase-like regulatory domain-containing protein [Gemmataceae bacterium]
MYGFVISCITCSLLLFGVAALTGCDDCAEPPTTPAESAVEIGSDFDATTAGMIRGRVTWQGTIPEVPGYRSPISPGAEHAGQPRRFWPNPNVPRIDPAGKGIAGAVVFLRGVDPRRSRPWDHPPVRVELRDYQIHVCQGDRDDRSGFVRRGEAIEMASRQNLYHVLRVRGAAFFTRAFPDADQLCSQPLERCGIVELASGCGYFWMRSWLFVDDHPYYTHSDAEGRFSLPQVPPGRYELVCWLPDWHENHRELDAETALICRLTFRPPVEIVQPVQLAPRQTQTVSIQVDSERFGGGANRQR